jgi:hypothetical protein
VMVKLVPPGSRMHGRARADAPPLKRCLPALA